MYVSLQSCYFYIYSIQGSLRYETIGNYPAPSFFSLNTTTGEIKVARGLMEDGLQRSQYNVRALSLSLFLSLFLSLSRAMTRQIFKMISISVFYCLITTYSIFATLAVYIFQF